MAHKSALVAQDLVAVYIEPIALGVPIYAEGIARVPCEHHIALILHMADSVLLAAYLFEGGDFANGLDVCFKLMNEGNLCHNGLLFVECASTMYHRVPFSGAHRIHGGRVSKINFKKCPRGLSPPRVVHSWS